MNVPISHNAPLLSKGFTSGDLIELAVMGGPITNDTIFSPNMAGCCVRLRFTGLSRRDPTPNGNVPTDPVPNVSSLSITVEDPGYDANLNPVTVSRVVNGTLPLKLPTPTPWGQLPNQVPPRTFCTNMPVPTASPASLPSLKVTSSSSTTNKFTVTSGSVSGLSVGTILKFIGNAFGGVNTSLSTPYYVSAVDTANNAFSVSATLNGPTLALTTGTGIMITAPVSITQTLTITSSSSSTNMFTVTGGSISNFAIGHNIQFSGGTFGGVSASTAYYISSIDTINNKFSVSTTLNGSTPGSTLSLTTATGTMSAQVYYPSWYYTTNGGTKGSTTPVIQVLGQTQSDGGITWECWRSNLFSDQIPLTPYTTYVDATVDSDVYVYAVLDMPIYSGTQIVGVSMGGNVYQVGSLSSQPLHNKLSVINNSTITYELVQPVYLTPPHQLYAGSVYIEAQVDHSWGLLAGKGQMIAGVKFTAKDAAETASVTVTTLTSSLSTSITTSSPGGNAVECYAATINTASLPAGDCFVEAEFFPWLGTSYKTKVVADGANWTPNTTYTNTNLPYYTTCGSVLVRNGNNYYVLSTTVTSGISASSGGPTGTTQGIVDGTCVWNYFGDATVSLGNLSGTIQASHNIPARWYFYNDPYLLYKTGYCFVDPNGTASTVAAVYSSFAAASAASTTLSNCFPDVTSAATALSTYNNTAGGGLTTHNDCGNGHIYLKAGNHTTIGAGMNLFTRPSVWLYILADPSAAAGTVIFATPASDQYINNRCWFGGGIILDTNGGGRLRANTDFASSTPSLPGSELVFDKATLKPQSTASYNGVVTYTGAVWYTNCIYTGGGFAPRPGPRLLGILVAGCNIALGSAAAQASPANLIGNYIKGSTSCTNEVNINNSTIPSNFFKIVDNRFYGLNAAGNPLLTSLGGGNTPTPSGGASIIGNLIKVSGTVYVGGTGGQKCGQLGADGGINNPIRNYLYGFNTAVGANMNQHYNDSNSSTGAENNSLMTQCYHAYNITLQDAMIVDDASHALSVQHGYRCQNYWPRYGVGYRYNLAYVNDLGSPLNGSGIRNGINSVQSAYVQYDNATPGPGIGFPLVTYQFIRDTSGTSVLHSETDDGDFHPSPGVSLTVSSSNSSTNKFYVTTGSVSNLLVNLGITFVGAPFGGINNSIMYYINSIDTVNNAFTISSTSGGTLLSLTDGSGTMSVSAPALAVGMALTPGRRYDITGALRYTNGTGAVGAYEKNF